MTPETAEKERRPVIAGLFGLLSPGLGHLYCGKPRVAVAWALAAICVGNLSYAVIVFWDVRPYNVLLPVLASILFYCFQIGAAWTLARRQKKSFALHLYNRWYYYLTWLLLATVVNWFVSPFFGSYQTFFIPTPGMEDTLIHGDRVMVDMSAYDTDKPARGDVVVFIYPGDGITRYVKRCLAVPGDTVVVKAKILYVNAQRFPDTGYAKYVDTAYDGSSNIQPRRAGGGNSRDFFGPYVVPPDSYFMLGDNRDNSADSRYWGSVPRELILGRFIRVIYSPDWSRIGLVVE